MTSPGPASLMYDGACAFCRRWVERLHRYDRGDAWLADFPSHPLADLVRLMKVRVEHFHGHDDAAFDLLLQMYPRRRARVLYEMRYLVMVQAVAPPSVTTLLAKNVPPEVLTGFVPEYALPSAEEWDRLWTLSEAHRGDAWATNLQERLLWAVARTPQLRDPLPTRFPGAAAVPTELWGQLRLAALVQLRRWDDAEQQAGLLAPDPVVGACLGAIRLARGDAWGAMQAALPDDAKRYVIRVLLRDDELLALARSGTPWEKREAALALGVRTACAGDWRGAAAIVRETDPERARLWQECATLAADYSTAGRLAWARFLVQHRGRLFYGPTGWFRTLSEGRPREQAAAPARAEWTADYERDAIRRHLLQNEAWLGLQAYVAYLEHASGDRTAALREADGAYNYLINMSVAHPTFWDRFLADDETVRRLRVIGRAAHRDARSKRTRGAGAASPREAQPARR